MFWVVLMHTVRWLAWLSWVAILVTLNFAGCQDMGTIPTGFPASLSPSVTITTGATAAVSRRFQSSSSEPNTTMSSACDRVASSLGTKDFITRLFDKYAEGSSRTISRSMLDSIFNNLQIGSVWVNCDPLDLECKSSLGTEHRSDAWSPTVKLRSKRSTQNRGHADHESHWSKHLEDCITVDAMLRLHGLDPRVNVSRDDFVRLCPALVQQADSGRCVHRHSKLLKAHADFSLSKSQIWGYGILAITIVSLLSLVVISLIPCLKKSYYHKVMAYLVALAVGTLAGDAMLHLIPHAFGEGAISSMSLQLSEEMALQQHYSQVWRACFVLVGIYSFFCVEQLMKMKAIYCGRPTHSHSHGGEEGRSREDPNLLSDCHAHGSRLSAPASPSEGSSALSVSEEEERGRLKANGIDLVDVNIEDGAVRKLCHNTGCAPDAHLVDHCTKEGHYHADTRQHHHHHGEKGITEKTTVSSIAWMVIVGDGFHNFTDGLAIGVAFSASLSSGLSTAIAVFCHELPHELGDFAVLINSGMSFKQAVIYNMVSAGLAYAGLVVGILVGTSEEGRHFVLSITAGLFLYISLADMLPELTDQLVPHQSIWSSFLCQHMGILTGIAIMLIISLFEHSI